MPCGDAAAAAVALANALAARPQGLAATLVNLGGYAARGAVPSVLRLVEAAVLLVPSRQSRRRTVEDLVDRMPPGKLLGAILIG